MIVSVDLIQMFTADAFGIPVSAMRDAKRHRAIARPRQVAMYLARELTTRSLPEIGRNFGGRDHTTVLHACRRIRELMAGDASFRDTVLNVRARVSALQPSRHGFNAISLGEWLALARRINIPHIRAQYVAEARTDDLRYPDMPGDDARAARLRAFFKAVYDVDTSTEMLRWDCCAPDGIKHALASGACLKPPPHMISLDEPRILDILDQLPPTQTSVTVWRRPWTVPRLEGGYPVEYRVFVSAGQVIGVSNYYPQRALRPTGHVEHEIKLATIYAESMIAGQKQRLVNPQIQAAGLDPAQMHCTMDFMATPRGLVFLEGGPPSLPAWGAHPCCFEGRAIDGVALGLMPEVEAA
jgi:hypothetical protein